jgi:hypothetical protein
MEVNQEPEDKLWSISDENPPGIGAIKYLVKRLESYLQSKLILNTYQDEISEEGFCWTFKSDNINAFFSTFSMTFNGIIGMQTNLDGNTPHYCAGLFLFGDKIRLISKDEKSYIELFYEKQSNGIGEWRSLGWQEDEFGEFEDVEEETYGLSHSSETSNITEHLQVQEKPAKPTVQGLVIAKLVQLGFADYNMIELNKHAQIHGFYRNPLTERLVVKDIGKAAESLGEGFIFTFYTDQNDFTDQANCIGFTVKDGRFTNSDGWELVYNKEKEIFEAVLQETNF